MDVAFPYFKHFIFYSLVVVSYQVKINYTIFRRLNMLSSGPFQGLSSHLSVFSSLLQTGDATL